MFSMYRVRMLICVEWLFCGIQRFAPGRALLLGMAAPHSAKVEAALASEFESHEVRGICKQADDTPEAPLVYIACAHKFHQECLDAYKAARGFSDDEMQRPMC